MRIANCKLKISSFVLIGLLILTGYLAWIYRAELNIISELNDNTFQFTLVQQMESIVNLVFKGTLSFPYLLDNWNHIWSQGAPLALYYNHLPQLLTVLSFKILNHFLPFLSLYYYFEIIKYCVLILSPLSFFIGARLLRFSYFTALMTALLSAFIFTFGSYGLDVSSYLFMGFGLTSQLQATFFMPLVLGLTFRYLESPNRKWLILVVVFNFLTLQTHVGMGTILLISEGLLIISMSNSNKIDFRAIFFRLKNFLILLTTTIFATAYFLLPIIIFDAYRNFSHWEGLWKFNSFGWQKITGDFLNGLLFDHNRLPIITLLVVIGFFYVLLKKPKYASLNLGFGFWVLGFFGRTTWGNIFDLLPGLSDFYLHRFIVGVHFFGILLGALGCEYLINQTISRLPKKSLSQILATFTFFIVVFLLIKTPVKNYAQTNNFLINQANHYFEKDQADFKQALSFLLKEQFQKRIYAGTPGNWGKDFTVGQTPVYQRLSVANLPVVNFYAHSWSLSSEDEPFFDESKVDFYDLYNVGYVVAPPEIKLPEFAEKKGSFGKYQVYQVKTEGYFGLGQPGPAFFSSKNNFINIVHLWQISPLLKAKIYPFLSLEKESLGKATTFPFIIPQFKMIDLNNYQDLTRGETKNIWETMPFSADSSTAPQPELAGQIIEGKSEGQQKFKAQVTTDCKNCLVIFKMTYHPNWQAKIDNQPAEKFMVFPSFMAVKAQTGTHQISFEYRPSQAKLPLLTFGGLILAIFFFQKSIFAIKI